MKTTTELNGHNPQSLQRPSLIGRLLVTLAAILLFGIFAVPLILTTVVSATAIFVLGIPILVLYFVAMWFAIPRIGNKTREVVTAEFYRQFNECVQQDKNVSIYEFVGTYEESDGSTPYVLGFELADGFFASELMDSLVKAKADGRLPKILDIVGNYACLDEDVDLMTIGFIFHS
jgi:hypothetical protein